MTLSGLAKMIDQYAQSNFAKGTGEIYKYSFQNLIESIGDIVIKGVTPILIEKFKQDCLKKVSPVRVNMYLRTLRAAFHLANNWKIMDENPARACKLVRVPDKEPAYFTKEKIAILIQQISDVNFKRLVLFAILTGMRRVEIANLKWEDMDFNQGLIRVRNRDLFCVKGGHPRTIPMPSLINKCFSALQTGDGYVFTDSKGIAISAYHISRTFKKYIRISKLPEEFHFHSLRHTCATLYVQGQMPIYEVQKLLGHRSISTTQIYAHLESDNLRRSLERIDVLGRGVSLN
jgi:integrase